MGESYPLYFEHEPLDLRKNTIRLIQVQRELLDGFLQCHMRTTGLPCNLSDDSANSSDESEPGSSTPYWCLSYTWGPPTENCMIWVNGRLFHVRRNLWDFLDVARQCYWTDEWLWIDALSIDQSNITERNHQVQSMGTIYSNAKRVLVWLGNTPELRQVMRSMKEEKRARFIRMVEDRHWRDTTHSMGNRRIPAVSKYEKDSSMSSSSNPKAVSLRDYMSDVGIQTDESLDASFGISQYSSPNIDDAKAERIYENFAQHEYWTRAWITQEIILGRRVMVVVGEEEIHMQSLALQFRNAFSYIRTSGFEHFADLMTDKRVLESWGLINLLHHFRDKKCAIRKDRIYSLLALCGDAKELAVDYNIPEKELMVQTLEVCKSSLCFCSAAVVSRALGPWQPASFNNISDQKPFVELHLYALSLDSTSCYFCRNLLPFSWTKKKGLLFCLGTACPDTHGHLFWESGSIGNKASSIKSNGKIYFQSRRESKSKDLCLAGEGLEMAQSEYKNAYIVSFTLEKLVQVLQEEFLDGEPGLRSCGNLWPNEEKRVFGEGRLRFSSR